MPLRRGRLLAALLATLVAGGAHAAVSSTSPTRALSLVAWKPRAWAPPAQGVAASAGLRVAIDPVDGTLGMPAPAELAPLAVFRDDAPVHMTYRANGSGRAQLDDRWADFAVVSLGADGKPVWSCVHGSRGAERFMQQPCAPVPVAVSPSGAPWADK